MSKLRIGLIGTYSNSNVGDYLLVECAQSLLLQQSSEFDVKIIDIDPHNEKFYSGRRKLNFKIFKILKRHKDNPLFQSPSIRYCYGYFMNWIKVNWYYREQIKNTDCLIFAGGGFIKFKTQGLNYPDEQILKIAQKQHIPVMFNAVGVEGYDEKDIRCRRLKKTLNSDVVKTITTRDYLDTLNSKYVPDSNITTDLVGDTVFWLKECTPIRKKRNAKKIGINLINPENFKAYGGNAEYATIEKFYINLIQELMDRKVDFQLFTNGMKVDYKFGVRLIKKLKLPKQILIDRPKNSEEYLKTVSEFNVILAGRMHAGIVAYALDIPRVGLIWSEKIDFFAKLINERATYFNENELNPKKTAELLCNPSRLSINQSTTKKLKNNMLKYLKEFIDDVVVSKNYSNVS